MRVIVQSPQNETRTGMDVAVVADDDPSIQILAPTSDDLHPVSDECPFSDVFD
jgi:hypothetical protein